MQRRQSVSSPLPSSSTAREASSAQGKRFVFRRFPCAAAAAVGFLCAVVAGWWFVRPWWLWQEATEAARRQHWASVEQALVRYAWYRPGDFPAQRLRSLAAVQRGDLLAAVRALEPIPASAPEAAQAHLTRGRLWKDLFRAREAEAEFRECLAIEPEQVEARVNLIIMLGVQRRRREQEDQLWALHDHGGRPLEALRMLAQAAPVIPAGSLSKTTDEGFVLEQCLKADPADPHIRPALAFFYRNRGDLDRAFALLRPWIEGHPERESSIEEYVACLLDAGDLAATRAWVERPPSTASCRFWQLRADWLQRQGRRDEAIASLRHAIELDPRDPEAHYRLGQALHQAGQAAEARQELAWHAAAQQLRKLAATIPQVPTDPAPLVSAGRLCSQMKRVREARGWYALALRLDPANAEARAGVAGTGSDRE